MCRCAGKVYLQYAVSCRSHISPGNLYLHTEFSTFLEEYFFPKNNNKTGYN